MGGEPRWPLGEQGPLAIQEPGLFVPTLERNVGGELPSYIINGEPNPYIVYISLH